MADVKSVEEPSESIFNCRLTVRTFNNKITDAALDEIYRDVPCNQCRKLILDEVSELLKECGRLIDQYSKDAIPPSQIAKVCCVTCSKDDQQKCHQDNKDHTRIKEVMSETRKIIRDHNDRLDDILSKNGDERPCERCRESLLKECQKLVAELEKATNQFQKSTLEDKYTRPCDYVIKCKDEVARKDGARGRSNVKQHQHDSGFHSVNSEILRREATESMDDNQTASADTTQPKHLNTEAHTEGHTCSCSSDKADVKELCVTLEVSMDNSNTTDA